MLQSFEQYYRRMQVEIGQCRQQDVPELERTECSFRIAARCWLEAREVLLSYQFASESEEIDFFKNTKPLFTSQIELHTLIYQAILFRPETDEVKIASFWENESCRLERFLENRASFVEYYRSGDTSLDRQYFLRQFNTAPQPDIPRVYDKISSCSTSHDWLVAALMAQEMYHNYTLGKLVSSRES